MFLQFLQDKPLGVVSVFMTGKYPRQPVDENGPLSLRCWSQLAIYFVIFDVM